MKQRQDDEHRSQRDPESDQQEWQIVQMATAYRWKRSNLTTPQTLCGASLSRLPERKSDNDMQPPSSQRFAGEFNDQRRSRVVVGIPDPTGPHSHIREARPVDAVGPVRMG